MVWWMTCNFTPFLKVWNSENERLYAMEPRLQSKRFPPQAALKPGSARSVDNRLIDWATRAPITEGFKLQSTLVISKSKGPSETLRHIRTSTYQICRMKENTIRTTDFRKWTCISSFACKLLCRHSALIAKENYCINFNFCITIIMLYLSKIRGILKMWFFVPTLTSTNTLDVRF